MTEQPITHSQLKTVLDTISDVHLAELQDLRSERRRYDAKTFHRELTGHITEALRNLGFCWRTRLNPNDALFDQTHAALYDIGRLQTEAYLSNYEHVRRGTTADIARLIMMYWEESGKEVIRRSPV